MIQTHQVQVRVAERDTQIIGFDVTRPVPGTETHRRIVGRDMYGPGWTTGKTRKDMRSVTTGLPSSQ